MLHSITVAKTLIFACVLLIVVIFPLTPVQCKTLVKFNTLKTDNLNQHNADNKSRQFVFLTGVGRETSTPDFIRLVVMRFIYGMATTMGVEERLEGLFNGAFVPPNADVDFFGFGDDAADGSDFDEAALGGLFDDDVF